MDTAERTQIEPRSGVDRRTIGLTALTGLVLFLVSLGGFTPEPSLTAGTASADEIRQFAEQHTDLMRLNAVSAVVGAGLLAFFVAGLAQMVRQARPGSVVPGVLLISGASAIAAALLQSAGAAIFAFPHEIDDVSDTSLVTMFDVSAITEFFSAFTLSGPCMVLVASFSYVGLRRRLIARWVCWVGLVIVALDAVLAVGDSGVPIGIPGSLFLVVIFGWWLWPLFVGGALGVRWLRTR